MMNLKISKALFWRYAFAEYYDAKKIKIGPLGVEIYKEIHPKSSFWEKRTLMFRLQCMLQRCFLEQHNCVS